MWMLCFYTISPGFIVARDVLSFIGLPERSINISLNIKSKNARGYWGVSRGAKNSKKCCSNLFPLWHTEIFFKSLGGLSSIDSCRKCSALAYEHIPKFHPRKTSKLPWKHPPNTFLGKILEKIFFQFWTAEFLFLKGLFGGGVGAGSPCYVAELATVIKYQYVAPSFASRLFGKKLTENILSGKTKKAKCSCA